MKKLTKKDIYKKYAIEYDPKTGKIYHELFGWINPVLCNGNGKLGKSVWTFSTLASNETYKIEINGIVRTVKGTCTCKCIGCYAMAGRYVTSTVQVANARKTILARCYIGWLKRAILAQIEADKIKLCRVHASGDFCSKEYVEMWQEIVSKCQDTVFWTYTKVKEYESAFDDFSNANIVKSLIPDIGLNYGHCKYIIDTYNALKSKGKSVYICRCGIDKNQHCVNCKGCTEHEYVLFVEHSTDYIAEKDEHYEELKTLIENQ